ncbi:MAG: patatin-like phospholipase family protein [Candidatus Zixiibacteriota bacterium]
MPKTALVLSGGGAKGAFQVAAEQYAREAHGFKWDIIAGVSVGALNASLIAMGRQKRLREIWETMTKEQVHTGALNLWTVLKLLTGRRGIYDNAPLRELIAREIDPTRVPTDVVLRVGAVSLETGKYHTFSPADAEFADAVFASTSMPVIWPPVEVSARYPSMADGGLRNISPLGDVLDFEPERVVIINCNSREPKPSRPLDNILDVARRALLDIALNEIFVTDLREFLRINQNVLEAGHHKVDLHNGKGRPYKYYEPVIIEPEEDLDDTLDFSHAAIQRSLEAGYQRAKAVLD